MFKKACDFIETQNASLLVSRVQNSVMDENKAKKGKTSRRPKRYVFVQKFRTFFSPLRCISQKE